MTAHPYSIFLLAFCCSGLAIASGPRYAVDHRLTLADVEATRVVPIHVERDGLTLGDDEAVEDGRYCFRPNNDTFHTDYTRALVAHTATFEGYYRAGGGPSRWDFLKPGDQLTYRHAVGRQQLSARMEVNLIAFESGTAVVEAGRDGVHWVELGRYTENGNHAADLPADLFPANAIYVRVRSEGKFVMYTYVYRAKLAGAGSDLVGNTCFVETTVSAKGIGVAIDSVGSLAPSDANSLAITLTNPGPTNRSVALSLSIAPIGRTPILTTTKADLSPGKPAVLKLPYRLTHSGAHELSLTITDAASHDTLYQSFGAFTVPPLLAADYGYRLPADAGLGLWWCEGTYKVGRDRLLPDARSAAVRISAARNEYEPFQLVLKPTRPISAFRVTMSDLTGPGGATIAHANLRANLVGYVEVKCPDDAFGCAGYWPDPLPDLPATLDLPPGKNQPLWFTVFVPESTKPGLYRGHVDLAAPGLKPTRVPVELLVRTFALPVETHTKTAFGLWMVSPMADFHAPRTDEQRDQIHDLYLRDFAAHRIAPVAHHYNLIDLVGITPRPGHEGEFDLDLAKLDQWCHHAFDELHIGTACLGWYEPWKAPFGKRGDGPNYGDADFKTFTPTFERSFRAIYGPLTQHLREKGWLDKVYFYLFDEPFAGKRFAQVREGARLLHDACPGLKGLVTVGFEPSLVGSVDIWCPMPAMFDVPRMAERQQAGDEIWWYLACGPRSPFAGNLIDHPALNQRIHFWIMQKYGITGTLYWSVNYYRGMDRPGKQREIVNPWEQAMCLSPDGGFDGNGDGVLVYPPTRKPIAVPVYEKPTDPKRGFYDPLNGCWYVGDDPVIKGPVSSIRWENIREGLEDREYFWLLEQELKRVRPTATTEQAKRAVAEGEAALATVDQLVRSLTDFETDPARLYAARDRLARALESLRPL
jgi:hypothetical protein